MSTDGCTLGMARYIGTARAGHTHSIIPRSMLFVVVVPNLIPLTLCVVTLSREMTKMVKIFWGPSTRAVFGCATHGYAVRGD